MLKVSRLLLLLVVIGVPVKAQLEEQCDSASGCIETGEWQLSLAIGLGGRTNPLQDGDPIPLVLLPDIAWYGENAYWDNDEVGYQWLQQDNSAAEVFLTINKERAFFSFWQPSNIFAQPSFGTASVPGVDTGILGNEGPTGVEDDSLANSNLEPLPPVSIDSISSRDWSVDMGLRWHYYWPSSGNGQGEWQVAVTRDISGVHQGSQFLLNYQHQWQYQDWQWGAGLGLTYKSDRLIDYYYGLDEGDNLGIQFDADGGWQPTASVQVGKRLSERWQWLFFASYQHLHSGMTDSPLVRRGRVITAFTGAVYRF